MKLLFTYSILVFFICKVYCDDILGCGGFIKSHIPIEFSKVEIGLYTKQGSLKDVTDCAPNNGYYFLPVYDNGDYILRVSAPTGWNFEPTEVSVTVDGENDACSLGKDINFVFAGFSVSGKVISEGTNDGPAGVTVSLYDEKGNDVLLKVKTVTGGEYAFPKVAPGRYELRASHPNNWIFSVEKAKLIVSPGSHNILGTITVAGYPVSGVVSSNNEAIAGVSFVLFAEGGKKITTPPTGCLKSTQGICRAESNDQGKFTFPALPPGNYKIVPHYAAGKEQSTFDVRPRELRFTVEQNELQLNPEFQVKGFTVTGKVLISKNGPGVADAKVFLNNEQRALTGNDGSFRVENMQAGNYIVTAQAENIRFDEEQVKVSPGSPTLPTIIASGLAVCGKVELGQLPIGVLSGSRTVSADLLPDLSESFSTETSNDGSYCIMLKPGNYKLYVHVTGAEIRKGLKFAPPTKEISVTTVTIKNINFYPLRASVTGKVNCLSGNCEGISVILSGGSDTVPISQSVTKEGNYAFSDVLPGQYEMEVTSKDQKLCWEKEIQKFVVTSAQFKVSDFIQSGFSMIIISSHDSDIEIKDRNDKKISTFSVTAGENTRCVPGSGPYILVPKGCHVFEKNIYNWELKSGVVNMKAVKHSIGGSVLTPDKSNDVTITILNDKSAVVDIEALKPEMYSQGGYEYRFYFMASPGETLTLVPKADKLVFIPDKMTIKTVNDCQPRAIIFNGDKGYFIEGKITPPLENVEITVSLNEDVVKTMLTDELGRYSAGPLPTPAPNQQYEVNAIIDGYQVTRTNDGFTARKLAEVIVSVSDIDTGESLAGVLLSLSGGDYRRNIQAGSDGTLTFKSLGPGEYFLKPKLKEYKFEPQSKVFNVAEGATINVKVSGRRVAFSCIGSLVSLSGDPEPGVILEAVGTGAACKDQQEEAVSEINGYFRIRGLLPQCEYIIKLKENIEANKHISRISPKNIKIKVENKDIEDIKIIAMRPAIHCDVSVLVINYSPGSLLRLRVYKDAQPDVPILERKLEPVSMPQYYLILPPLPNDGQSYYVQVDAAPGNQQRTSIESKYASFVANSSVRNVRIEIGNKIVADDNNDNISNEEEEQDGRGGSITLLFFIGVFGVLAMYRSQIASIFSHFNGAVKTFKSTPPVNTPVAPINLDQDLIVEPVINKRKNKPRKT